MHKGFGFCFSVLVITNIFTSEVIKCRAFPWTKPGLKKAQKRFCTVHMSDKLVPAQITTEDKDHKFLLVYTCTFTKLVCSSWVILVQCCTGTEETQEFEKTKASKDNEKLACRFQSCFSHGNANMGQSWFSVRCNEVTHNTETKHKLAWHHNDMDSENMRITYKCY